MVSNLIHPVYIKTVCRIGWWGVISFNVVSVAEIIAWMITLPTFVIVELGIHKLSIYNNFDII